MRKNLHLEILLEKDTLSYGGVLFFFTQTKEDKTEDILKDNYKDLYPNSKEIHISRDISGQVIFMPPIKEKISLTHKKEYFVSLWMDPHFLVTVDLEKKQIEKKKALLKYVCASEERIGHKILKSKKIEKNLDFLTILWSAKESASKYLGLGMSISKDIFEVREVIPILGGYRVIFEKLWSLEGYCIETKDYVLSFCFPKESRIELDEESIKKAMGDIH